jgi:thymidylate synthase
MKSTNNLLDPWYQALLSLLVSDDQSFDKSDRTGTGTKSLFGIQFRHNMRDGFPLLTTKKMAWKTMVTELLWFLRGDTNIKYLLENNCHIWDGDAYKNYLKNSSTSLDGMYLSKEEFIYHVQNNEEWGNKWGDLGPIYGKQWREWTNLKQVDEWEWTYDLNGPIDQIQNLINELKTNPDSRRLMVNAWNVGELDKMVLPPCHYGFQVYTRELSLEERLDLVSKTYENYDPFDFGLPAKVDHDEIDKLYPVPRRGISLMWNQRSVDTFLGLPFNIASYGLLLEIIAKEVNMVSDQLIGNLGDVHLYKNHIEAAKEQIGRKYTSEERQSLLKDAMGETNYREVLNDLVPFGGGMSEYYEIYKIPYMTKSSYPLPKLRINGDEPSIIEKPKYWKPDDFIIENYQYHPSIKAPLSN